MAAGNPNFVNSFFSACYAATPIYLLSVYSPTRFTPPWCYNSVNCLPWFTLFREFKFELRCKDGVHELRALLYSKGCY